LYSIKCFSEMDMVLADSNKSIAMIVKTKAGN
jgi:hypothetical protein